MYGYCKNFAKEYDSIKRAQHQQQHQRRFLSKLSKKAAKSEFNKEIVEGVKFYFNTINQCTLFTNVTQPVRWNVKLLCISLVFSLIYSTNNIILLNIFFSIENIEEFKFSNIFSPNLNLYLNEFILENLNYIHLVIELINCFQY